MISAKKALGLSGSASLAVLLRFSVPLLVSCLPSVWRCFVSWLQPPYVYVLLNGIIVTIAASSRFGGRGRSTEAPPPPAYHDNFVCAVSPASVGDPEETSEQISACESHAGSGVGEEEGRKEEEEEEAEAAEEFTISRSFLTPPQVKREETENVPPEGGLASSTPAEKPLVSSRLSHRRPVKLSSPEGGKVLGVTKSRRQETLENTWRSITEGRPMPLTRHLKKCETSLENKGRPTPTSPDQTPVKRSATLRDKTNEMPTPEDRTAPRKEGAAVSSLSRDELNRRVEAFITKFNEEMRRQRQETLDQYRTMVSRQI